MYDVITWLICIFWNLEYLRKEKRYLKIVNSIFLLIQVTCLCFKLTLMGKCDFRHSTTLCLAFMAKGKQQKIVTAFFPKTCQSSRLSDERLPIHSKRKHSYISVQRARKLKTKVVFAVCLNQKLLTHAWRTPRGYKFLITFLVVSYF